MGRFNPVNLATINIPTPLPTTTTTAAVSPPKCCDFCQGPVHEVHKCVKFFDKLKDSSFFLEFTSFIFLLLDAVCFANLASTSAAAAAAAAQQYAASSAQTGLWTKGCCSYWCCCHSCHRGICCLCSTAAQVDKPDQLASQPASQPASQQPASQPGRQLTSQSVRQPTGLAADQQASEPASQSATI
jgi:hypothetical protein